MANFIETTLANAAARKATAEAESVAAAKRASAEAERERASRPSRIFKYSEHQDPFYEDAMEKNALFRKGKTVFQQTGIQQTLEAIGGNTITIEDGYGDRSVPAVVLRKDGNSVIATYRKDDTLDIQGANTQKLTAADLQNKDAVAAALEKAVKNPMKGRPSHGGSDSSGPQGY